MIRRTLTLSAAMLALAPHAANAQAFAPVLSDYVAGLRKGDLDVLQRAFLAQGQFCAQATPDAKIDCESFSKVLPAWAAASDAKARGEIVASESVDDAMARVTYRLHYRGKAYLDHLLLYRQGDRWLIVAKTTRALDAGAARP